MNKKQTPFLVNIARISCIRDGVWRFVDIELDTGGTDITGRTFSLAYGLICSSPEMR